MGGQPPTASFFEFGVMRGGASTSSLGKFMRITRSVRIHKGTIAALLVFVPFVIATAKLTFFHKGCMDGFGHLIIGSAVIVLEE
jgi:hypothetical protein